MMRAEYWRDLVRRWVLVEEGIGSPDFLKLERAGLLREAVAALTSDGVPAGYQRDEAQCSAVNGDGSPCRRSRVAGSFCCEAHGGLLPRLNKSGGSDVDAESGDLLCSHGLAIRSADGRKLQPDCGCSDHT